MQIFKIIYDWYEGDHEEIYLGKDVDKKQFEKDIIEAKDFTKSLIGKKEENGEYLGIGYRIECLPEYYEQIIWFLINKKEYVECLLDDSEYSVDDEYEQEIIIERKDEDIIRTNI